jgi:hypothetical protein
MNSSELQEAEVKELILNLIRHDPRKEVHIEEHELLNLIKFSIGTFPSLSSDLVLLLKTKLLLYILPTFSEHESNNLAKHKIKKYLEAIGLHENAHFDKELLKILGVFKNNLLHSSKSSKKTGWGGINPAIRDRLLENQKNRCTICGIELKIGSANEPKSPEIDHILPWALGGDKEENLRITCKVCNNYKSNNYWSVNIDYVFLNYFLKEKNLAFQHLILWVMERDHSECKAEKCTISSLESEMYVSQLNPLGRLVYDNLSTFCSKCANVRDKKYSIHDALCNESSN